MSDDKTFIHFLCPHCDHPLKTKEKNRGRQFQCTECDHLINVPSAGGKTEHGHTWESFSVRPTKGASTTKQSGKEDQK